MRGPPLLERRPGLQRACIAAFSWVRATAKAPRRLLLALTAPPSLSAMFPKAHRCWQLTAALPPRLFQLSSAPAKGSQPVLSLRLLQLAIVSASSWRHHPESERVAGAHYDGDLRCDVATSTFAATYTTRRPLTPLQLPIAN